MKDLKLFFLIVAFVSTAGAADLKLEPTSVFDASFTVDSVHTKDGKVYELSASGDAGPYGRVYLSYVFTNKQDEPGYGEFTGHAWSQIEEDVVTATLQGVSKQEGKYFKLYTLDLVSNGKLNFAIGTVDLVEKTMNFRVGEID